MDNVLVIQGARFGDLIQSKRLILTLERRFCVHLLLDKDLMPLARILYPRAMLHGFVFHRKLDDIAWRHNRDTLAELAVAGFRRIYNCNFSRLTSAVCRIFPQGQIIGYRPAHDSDGGVLRSPWARMVFALTAMRSLSPLNLVDFWAFFEPDPVAPHQVNAVAKGGGKGIGIAVAGREERRSIPLTALAATAQTFFQMFKGPEIRLFGTEAEIPRAKKLQRLFTAPMLGQTRFLCGRTDWQTLVTEMTGLDCLITPDTGLMHLGAHLGVPVFAFFLSSAWLHETGPYGLGHKILQTAPPCAPCLEVRHCPNHLLCHEPYNQKELGRLVARAWMGGSDARWPGNVQLWQSALDTLGAAPRLLLGVDKDLERRQILRHLIKNKLALAPLDTGHIPEVRHLLREFEPAAEFMLPPERYY